MPYSSYTLSQFVDFIGDLLDDTNHVYWDEIEIQYAIWEGLRVWGALTSYWRSRGAFNLDPNKGDPYYDMSVLLPNLRTRTWTLNMMVQDIQFMLLENPSGIAGTGMSGQLPVQSILDAIQYGRNRFVLDVRFPLASHRLFGVPPSPQGTVVFDQTCVFVHRVSWQDSTSSLWTNLWREDAWSIDKGNYLWTTDPALPQEYSESELAPLTLQLAPPPINEGVLDALTVDSFEMDLTNPDTLFNVPDEWVHAIKYAALANLLSSGMASDDMRDQYAENRYQQVVTFAKDARSIIRLMSNNTPLNIDSLAAIDSGMYSWRNQSGAPQMAGILYDMAVIAPGMPDQAYGMTADVVQTAPLADNPGDFIQLGPEDLDHLVSYVCHILLFKCGGKDFTETMDGYDDFMRAVSSRKGVNAAKIKYFTPLFGQAQKEWAARPDRLEMTNA